MTGREQYAFGEFVLDVTERRLLKGADTVALAPKAHDLLVALVRHAGRLVTKCDLLALVWPDSFVEEGILSVHVAGLRKVLGDTNRHPTYIETVQRSGYRFTGAVRSVAAAGGDARPRLTVAVLPARLTGGTQAGSESIGLTMADALIERFGRVGQIIVRPVGSVRRYVTDGGDPVTVAQALHVDAVVASQFLLTADRLKMSVQLIRADDGGSLWAAEFDRPGTELGGIADAIVESVIARLGVRTPSDFPFVPGGAIAARRRSAARPLEAYEQFGRGRSHLLSASLFELPQAIAAFRAAIDADPAYAAAYAGLALACCAQASLRARPHLEAHAEAKTAALRALALDDECADAQVALGTVLLLSDWDWVGAERSLERALDINPNHTEAYLQYGSLMEALGRLDRGLQFKHQALERDPFSPLVLVQIATAYWHQRRYDEAIVWATKALDVAPNHLLAREFLAGAYWKKGDIDRLLTENIRQAESFGVAGEDLVRLRFSCAEMRDAYAAGGRANLARYQLAHLPESAADGPAIQLVLLHAELGDMDIAYRHLNRVIDSHDPCLVHLAVAPQWDCLRADPRFGDCLARMGLSAMSGAVGGPSASAPLTRGPLVP